MDSRTGFDDDEHFFERYASEHAAAVEFDAAEAQPPTPEQLAHLTRFRKPVAWLVVGLALFSLLGLEEHGARRAFMARYGAPRELVAHYGAAVARPGKAGAPLGSHSAPSAFPGRLHSLTDAGDCDPVADATPNSSSAASYVSWLTSMCLAEASSDPELVRPNDEGELSPAPALDLCLAGGQARVAWSLPPSTTSSSPSAQP